MRWPCNAQFRQRPIVLLPVLLFDHLKAFLHTCGIVLKNGKAGAKTLIDPADNGAEVIRNLIKQADNDLGAAWRNRLIKTNVFT